LLAYLDSSALVEVACNSFAVVLLVFLYDPLESQLRDLTRVDVESCGQLGEADAVPE